MAKAQGGCEADVGSPTPPEPRYLMKSLYSIQKTPSLLPWGMSSPRRCPGQCGHSSDQLPFQEKRPHGFRRRRSLRTTGLRATASTTHPHALTTHGQPSPYLEPWTSRTSRME